MDFEVNDVLVSIYYLLHQLFEGVAKVENTYDRVVKPEGNVKAQNISPLFLNNETQYGAVSELYLKADFSYAPNFSNMMRFQNLILQFPKRAQCHRAVYVRKYYWEKRPLRNVLILLRDVHLRILSDLVWFRMKARVKSNLCSENGHNN